MMRHTLYRTENLLDGSYYIGMHSCSSSNCRYLGSGKILRHAVQKYGEQNFVKVVLAECASRLQLAELEKKMITSDVLSDPLCMNLVPGGEGGSRAGSGCGVKKGFRHTAITRAKISKGVSVALSGKTLTKDHKQAIVASWATSRNFGTSKTEETENNRKLKIAASTTRNKSKNWVVVSPDGTETIVLGLRQWSRERGVPYTTLALAARTGKMIARGPLSGWKVRTN